MEKIKQFNLELALFVEELKSYSENVNEIDDETNGLLVEAILGVNRLQISSKFNETRNTNENRFVQDLNNDIFKCRRYILCCLCHEQIPLNSEDFDSHLQKKGHKAKEAEIKTPLQSQTSANDTGDDSSSSRNSTTSSLTETSEWDSGTPPSSVKSVRSNDQNASVSAISSPVALPPRPLNPQISINLEDTLKSEQSLRSIVAKMLNLTTRTKARISHEDRVLAIIQNSLKAIDSTLHVVPFGSSTYGFGGIHTNFNVFINTAASQQKPYQLLTNIEKLFKSKDDFEVNEIINGNRSQKRRLLMLYKRSNMLCSLHLEMDLVLVETSQIIRDYINHIPNCYHLIAYIRSLLITLGSFSFNTYIISVLVIFFLQNCYKCPKPSDLPATLTKRINNPPQVANDSVYNLKHIVFNFFNFWRKLEMGKHLISINVGRWQERELQPGQSNFTHEQRRLRDGIAEQPANWENCTMFVQDIKSPGLNITADISRDEVCNFKKMCQIFSTENMHVKLIDEYVSKLAPIHSTESPVPQSAVSSDSISNANKTVTTKSAVGPLNSLQSSKVALDNIPIASPKATANTFRIEDVAELARLGATKLLTRTDVRRQNERRIVEVLAAHFRTINPSQVVIVGSSSYGFGGPDTDLNILFKFGSSQTMQGIEPWIGTIGFPTEFKLVKITNANRVQMKQWKIVHKQSNIHCSVQFANDDSTLEQSSEIIRQYMSLSPKCAELIAYVKAWLNAMNDIARKSKLPECEFNTYIVALLVIFYLQRQHNLDRICDVYGMLMFGFLNALRIPMNELIKGFFHFYGNTYEQDIEVISLNVGSRQPNHMKEQQSIYTSDEKRLRDGMLSKPSNWTNCYMWVQDIVSDSTNITAEIPKNAVDMFVANCKQFSTHSLEFELNKATSTSSGNGDQMNQIKFGDIISKMGEGLLLDNFLEVTGHFEERISNQFDITTILNGHLMEINHYLKMIVFGSSRYGFKYPDTNLNLFINTGGESPSDVLREFEKYLLNSDIKKHFKGVTRVYGNRVIKQQIRLTHTESDINCFILFDDNNAVLESSEIIARFNEKVPMCHTLVKLVRFWQLSLLIGHSEAIKFNFNTYIISVLVIFFFQMKHNVPIIEKIWSIPSMKMDEPRDKLLYQFFCFYGHEYKMSSHVISAHVGQWMDRESSNSPAQERLRKIIDKNPASWNNCSMYVQDLVREDFNITAEVSRKAAFNFQQLCQLFAAYLKDRNPCVSQ